MEYRLDDVPEVADFLRHPRVQELLDHPSVSVRLVSPTGEYLYASSGIRRLLGYTPHELTTMDPRRHAHPDDAPMLAELSGALQNHGSIEFVARAITKDGRTVWTRSRLAVHDGNVAVAVSPTEAPADGKAYWNPSKSFLES